MFAALVMAAGLASLYANDILPIQRFGLFAAAGVLAAVGVLFAIVPVCLHRFPLTEAEIQRPSGGGRLARWARTAFEATIERRAMRSLAGRRRWRWPGWASRGSTRRSTCSNLLDDRTRLMRDYAWLEQHLGNLAPMEIVVTMPPERLRAASELAEQDGQQYRLTMLERIGAGPRHRAAHRKRCRTSAARCPPPRSARRRPPRKARADHTIDYALSKSLEQHRNLLLASDFLQLERRPASARPPAASCGDHARLKAIASEGAGQIDFGDALQDVQDAINPVLLAYQQRDAITQALHEQSKQLAGGARVHPVPCARPGADARRSPRKKRCWRRCCVAAARRREA